MPNVLEPLKKQTQNGNGSALFVRHEEEEVDPPPFFLCPISMELMLDPVTLTSGQTFDRRSIEQWLESGHVTCPVTRLPLQPDEEDLLIPNHTLRRMIQKWCLANNLPRLDTPKLPPNYQEIKTLLQTLCNHADCNNEDQILDTLRQLLAMGRHRARSRQLMLEADALLAVSSFLTNSYNTKIKNNYHNRVWSTIASEAWRVLSLLCLIASSDHRHHHHHRMNENALMKHWKPTAEQVSCILWFVAMGENMECKANATIVLDTLMPMVVDTRMVIMSMKESSMEGPFMGALLDILKRNATVDSSKQKQKLRQRAITAALRVLNCIARCSYVTNQLVSICIEKGGVVVVMEILKLALLIISPTTTMDPGHNVISDMNDKSNHRIHSLVEAGTWVLEALVCQSVQGHSTFIHHGPFVQTMVSMIDVVSDRVTENCLEIMFALLTWKGSLVNRGHLVNDMKKSVKRAMVEAGAVIKLVKLSISSSSSCKRKALRLLNLLGANMDWTTTRTPFDCYNS